MTPKYMEIIALLLCSTYFVTLNSAAPLTGSQYEFYSDSGIIRHVRADAGQPHPAHDEDVLELEHLKETNLPASSPHNEIQQTSEQTSLTLEQQLAAAAAAAVAIDNLRQHDDSEQQPKHDSAVTQSDTNGNNINKGQLEAEMTNINAATTASVGLDKPTQPPTQLAPPKLYHGAARLAFGQHPIPPLETPVSSTSTTTSSTILPPTTTQINDDITFDVETNPSHELTNNGERRSPNQKGPKNGEFFFKHNGGQYSALDMAQYVFWTGDEEGVAKAVEEFIQKGMMARDDAIKFLKDISLGIKYLENAYSNNQRFNEIPMKEFSTITTPPTTTTTNKPEIEKQPESTVPAIVQSAIKHLPALARLTEISNERMGGTVDDYAEAAGRMRIVDFLYREYSLEDIVYQLAKAMFSQSLTKGSEQAQISLQRLTTFLETEGATGQISPQLLKKILDVLLAALSDCLAEHPDLLLTAKESLNLSMQIPHHQEKQ